MNIGKLHLTSFPHYFGVLSALLLSPLMVILVVQIALGGIGWRSVIPFAAAAVLALFLAAALAKWLFGKDSLLSQTLTDMLESDYSVSNSEPALAKLGALGDQVEKVAVLLDKQRKELGDQIRASFGNELSSEKQRMEGFLRGIGDGISIVDTEMRVIFVNDAIRKVFDDHTGEFCYRIYEHKNAICGGCPVKKAMDTGEVHHSLRRMYDKHGRLRYFESTGSPIHNERGEIVAGIELARDVTQRIKLERRVEIRSRELAIANEELLHTNEQLQNAFEELKNAQRQLTQSEKMASLGVLVAGIAHEINNPLNFVSVSTQLLDEHLQSLLELLTEMDEAEVQPQARERLEQLKKDIEYDYVLEDTQKIVKNIGTGAERMKKIVQNLRTFSRLDSGEKVPVNLREGIESTLQLLFYEYKNRIEIVQEYDDIPQIIGSPGELNQVFMNVLHNAIQAIPNQGQIKIAAREDGDSIRISFADTGPGIPPDEIDHLFDPFYTTKKVGEGTGLGLSISYGIVQDHGGRLWVESELGKGTTFHIDLPICRRENDRKQSAEAHNGNSESVDISESEVGGESA